MNNGHIYNDPLLCAEFRSYLQNGETVLWAGKPYTSVPFRPHFGSAFFALIWCGFAVFWTVVASAGAGAFGLFGLPFVAVGLSLVYFVFVGQGRQYKQTLYAVTDRRAIILTVKRSGTVCTEFSFSNMQNVTMSTVREDTGTILFPVLYVQDSYLSSRHGSTLFQSSNRIARQGFFMIDNVHAVYRLISEQISAARN